MNVIDIMTTHPITIRLDQTLRDGLKLMALHRIKHLVVINNGHVVGVVSDRDCRHALNSPYSPQDQLPDEALTRQLQIRVLMSPAPIVIDPHAPASDAARLMITNRIGCLPVMRAETLVGILTRSDILIAFMTLEKRYEIAREPHGNPPAV